MPVAAYRILFFALCLCFFLSPARAQTAGGLPVPSEEVTAQPRRPQTYGTQSQSIMTLNAWEFEPVDSGTTTGFTGNFQRYKTGGSNFPTLVAGIHLPSGALVSFVEITGCDGLTNAPIGAHFVACPDPNGACSVVGQVASTVAGAPGCGYFTSPQFAHTIDNLANTYFIYMILDAADINLSFRNVRIYYQLQVSPDPAGQTFPDVPFGHPQHRFVEALFAAGITAGCGGGNYCPDAPLTRGQMAVFLSIALGLHHPY